MKNSPSRFPPREQIGEKRESHVNQNSSANAMLTFGNGGFCRSTRVIGTVPCHLVTIKDEIAQRPSKPLLENLGNPFELMYPILAQSASGEAIYASRSWHLLCLRE